VADYIGNCADIFPAIRSSDDVLGSSRVSALALTTKGVRLLDQNALPQEVRYRHIQTVEAMAEAIRAMLVRGAPAIGIAAAYGVVLGARQCVAQPGMTLDAMRDQLRKDIRLLAETRPTAVNLMWALGEMEATLTETFTVAEVSGETVGAGELSLPDQVSGSSSGLLERLTARAIALHEADIDACRRIGEYGAAVVPTGAAILTHCNAGALATGGYGTALGVVRSAFARDPGIRVFADETRPRFQGARLTTWELCEDGIPVTLIADNMAASLMRAGKIDLVVVGADRIAANGDTANKIGTYNLALIAHAHDVPFYVAAPLSTIDFSLANGDGIPIEERDPAEIAVIHGESICAPGVRFYNPAFDVTPARYIHGIITEKGIACPDFRASLAQFDTSSSETV
jgi:methylthioribose-1-phosphate isomerase